MPRFVHGHATHPEARMALSLALAQIEAQRAAAGELTLGWVYVSDHFAAEAGAMLAQLRQQLPGVAWVGAVGVGVAACGVEYFGEPAVVLMAAALPREHFRVFSGSRPLRGFAAHTAQVHADPTTHDLPELIADMSDRTATGYLFGGLASGQTTTAHIADAVLRGGLSGVAFSADVALVSRVTQGCQPVGPTRRITAADRNVVTALDGEPALECLLRDLGLAGADQRSALPRLRQTLVGLSDPADSASGTAKRGAFGADTRVRNLVGIDPGRGGIAIGDDARAGLQLAFCRRDAEAARRDLRRICAEIREETEPETLPLEQALARKAGDAADAPRPSMGVAGAIYISCAGRGGPHFGAPSAELKLVQQALGDVPLAGFFAAGEIARHHLYGYTGVLTVFRG